MMTSTSLFFLKKAELYLFICVIINGFRRTDNLASILLILDEQMISLLDFGNMCVGKERMNERKEEREKEEREKERKRERKKKKRREMLIFFWGGEELLAVNFAARDEICSRFPNFK
ncbi:Hypothetical predicted protein [Octopus vulgaris]|uniref:Uncharacterized protein n=1 Tax=Octopus vulgaris TaxID=6645 RepID=A0AA36AT84_OCTVU|nr:Hypothetical predicted protein [Octopus vulgaris]